MGTYALADVLAVTSARADQRLHTAQASMGFRDHQAPAYPDYVQPTLNAKPSELA